MRGQAFLFYSMHSVFMQISRVELIFNFDILRQGKG